MVALIGLLSFLGLIWSANHLVNGVAGLGLYLRIKPFLIGFTILAFGLTIPEIYYAMTHSDSLSFNLMISNAMGSNIANIGLVLGVTILLHPPKLHSALFRHGYPLLFLIMLLTYSFIIDKYLSVTDGCFLLLSSIALLGYLFFIAKHSVVYPNAPETFQAFTLRRRGIGLNIGSFIIGLLVITVSSHYLTKSLVYFAKWMQINPVIIQLTLIAICTSLPQLATCIIAAIKGQEQIAVGTILGSNMFNLLAVLSIPGIIHPSFISSHVIWRDMPMMGALTLVIFLMNYNSKRRMIRWHGGVLLLIYGCYMISLIIHAAV